MVECFELCIFNQITSIINISIYIMYNLNLPLFKFHYSKTINFKMGYPGDNLSLNQVQRGIIFMWFVAVTLYLINVIIQFFRNNLQTNLQLRHQTFLESDTKPQPPSAEDFQKNQIHQNALGMVTVVSSKISKPNQTSEIHLTEKTLLDKFTQSLTRLEVLMGFITLILLCVVTTTSYAFSLVLMFIVLALMFIFNVFRIHLFFISNQYIRVLLESLWLIAIWFWTLNIWTIINSKFPIYGLY